MQSLPITQLLAEHRAGNSEALNRAFEFVYRDLRQAASAQLRRGASPTLNTTSLVNEAYLRLADGAQIAPTDRSHFLALAARAMRCIVIDYARERGAAKRGGAVRHVDLDETEIAVEEQARELLALEESLEALAKMDERLVRIVECRFFIGMTEPETAEALQLSLSTVQRDWRRARAWLQDDMRTE